MVVAPLPDEVAKPMLRITLIDILMFALPFLLYAAYVLATRGTARTAATAGLWQGAPVLWLLAAGGALLLITMATLISFSGGKPGGTYHPPSLQNGVVKPGEID